jgi:hypothetical protein
VAIENGFLEHALETAAVRPHFDHWGSDSRLEPAWKRALEWVRIPTTWQDYFGGFRGRIRSEGWPAQKHHVR